ncbi:hypothetical protein [Bacillus sp. UNC41MFS5]|nr:hypothetical protein [Bacillus sp. UNC41MFS5]
MKHLIIFFTYSMWFLMGKKYYMFHLGMTILQYLKDEHHSCLLKLSI